MTSFNKEKLGRYLNDTDVESREGIWITFDGDMKFRILRAGGANHKFLRAFQKATRPYERQMQNGTMDIDLQREILIDIYVKFVITDWRGVEDADGNALDYDPEVAAEFFKAVPEIFRDLQDIASSAATWAVDNLREMQKQMGES